MMIHIPSNWIETDHETAEWLMENLECWRDGWSGGEYYVAMGYGRVVAHVIDGDRWLVHPMFRKP